MRAIRLRCEYLNDPIGVDFTHPRLMWNVEGGVKQTAYRIVTEKWDSGKVASSAMHADYPKALSDRERVSWRVCLWDENDEAGDWREAFFETGISAWQAQWITGDYAPKKNRRYPVDCFRKAFRAQSVEKARLYISEITGTDGSVQTVVTDGSWQWSSDGPIRFADNEDGEVVDASMAPSYAGKAKPSPIDVPLTASNNVFVTEHERFKPVEKIVTPSGSTVLKFPRNLCGYLAFRLNAKAGQQIHIRLGEMLDDAGEFTQKNIQCVTRGKASPLQAFTYTCKEGLNAYKPRFFYGGFQYALIETDIPFEPGDFTQIALYSDFPFTSAFDCSNDLINRFYRATEWSLKSNSIDIPSDCPTRERMGWTGDSQVFFGTASYLADYAAFARKHLQEVRRQAHPGGQFRGDAALREIHDLPLRQAGRRLRQAAGHLTEEPQIRR